MNVLEARRRLLGAGVYKKTVVGNPAIATDSLARMYPGIEMQGWTEQAQYEGNQLFDASKIPSKTQGGATVTNNGDGSFTISGSGTLTNNFSTNFICTHEEMVKIFKQGTLNAVIEAAAYPRLYINLYNSSGFVKTLIELINLTDQGEILQEYLDNEDYYMNIGFTASSGKNIIPGSIKPMIYQTGSGTWEPYTGGSPSPSPDYPQEIVSAGTKNQETEKWEYEITITNAQTDPDKNQTVTLTADRPLTKWDRLEKRGGQWGWVYKSAEVVFDGSEKWSLYPSANVGTVFYTTLPNAAIGFQKSLCDKYQNIDLVWDVIYDGVLGVYSDNAATKNKYFRPPSAAVETVEQFKSWLSENPLTVLFETSAETFVPLSESEQEAMNALYTYRPTTVLSNEQDCDMTLTYKTRKGMN